MISVTSLYPPGLYPPTSGTAIVYGKDINTQREDIIPLLGVCPQLSILYGNLTVQEHITLFAKVTLDKIQIRVVSQSKQ